MSSYIYVRRLRFQSIHGHKFLLFWLKGLLYNYINIDSSMTLVSRKLTAVAFIAAVTAVTATITPVVWRHALTRCTLELIWSARCRNAKTYLVITITVIITLGATYNDRLRLIEKREVDFLLALIEPFFARCYGWGATSDYWLKIGDFASTGVGWPKISGWRGRPPPTILLLRKLG